jgi:uncharacterized protein YbbC (DUF1343 family)
MRVATGLERLLADDRVLRGRRVGLIANPTTVDAELRHAVDLLAARPGITLTALFGPEHGVRGDAQDMISVDAARDPRTGVPVWSLYGHDLASLTPTAAMLDTVDVVVYDVQDVGSRYYTFVWTMVLAMRACAAAGKAFVVLDRPNPIGGVAGRGRRDRARLRVVRRPGVVPQSPRPHRRRDRALAAWPRSSSTSS